MLRDDDQLAEAAHARRGGLFRTTRSIPSRIIGDDGLERDGRRKARVAPPADPVAHLKLKSDTFRTLCEAAEAEGATVNVETFSRRGARRRDGTRVKNGRGVIVTVTHADESKDVYKIGDRRSGEARKRRIPKEDGP